MRDDYDWKAWWPWAKKNPLKAPEFTPEEIAEMSEATNDIVELKDLEARMEWIEDVTDHVLDGAESLEDRFDDLYLFGTPLRGIEDPYTLKAIIVWLMWYRRT